MFFRILRKSFLKRRGKVTIAIIAVIMGAAIPSAMFSVSLDINEKISLEFSKFGANLLIVPRSDTIDVGIGDISLSSVTDQKYINETDIYKIKTINWTKNILGYAPFLYQVIKAAVKEQEQQVVLVGTWFEKNTTLDSGMTFKTGVRKINSWWWGVEGNWANDIDVFNSNTTQECMIGSYVAEKLDLGIGDSLAINYNENPENTDSEVTIDLVVSGIITSGGSEDNHIFVSLPVAQSLTSRVNKVHTVQVSALCTGCPIETIAGEIENTITYSEARSILQVTIAEMSILGKIEQMMSLVTAVALLATALAVSTTLTTAVLERQTEIGLMKSIGAENREITSLFISEAMIIGFLGGVFGYIIGFVVAQFIGLAVFDSFVNPQLIVLPVVISISVIVTLVASLLPIRRAMNIEPAVVLRGE
ncbi:MAG: ABC transporter permease [Candidatus Hodarchaeales archaeon]|jgi:putative ABC transport system permease protein